MLHTLKCILLTKSVYPLILVNLRFIEMYVRSLFLSFTKLITIVKLHILVIYIHPYLLKLLVDYKAKC